MALKSILTAALLATASGAFAQTWVSDSVALGAGYANDAFYDLKQGSIKYQSGSDWHLAFQAGVFGEMHFYATVRANHAKKGVEVYLIKRTALVSDAPAAYAGLTAADTVGKTSASMALYNNDSSWGTGAFYQNRSTLDLFDFGWGLYQGAPTHSLLGNSIFLVKTEGNAYKFWVKEYVSTPADSIHYTFNIAKLDGSDGHEVKLYRKGTPLFTDRLMGYYDIVNNTILDREPSRTNWDIVFTQYKDMVSMGGPAIPYTVTGVLVNEGVQVAEVNEQEPDASKYATYSYATRADQIGWNNWKKNDPVTHQYVIPDTVNYFVKTAVYKEYYQIRFSRFDGSSTGKIVFQKRYLGKESVGVKNLVSNLNAFMVVPNPARSNASLMIDAKTAAPNARLLVTDMAGRVVANGTLDIRAGMNGFSLNSANWAAGTYVVTVAGADWKMSQQLVVAR